MRPSHVIDLNALIFHGKSSFLTNIVHQLFIALIVFSGLISCDLIHRDGTMEDDSRTPLFVFLPFRVQGGNSAGFLVPLHSSTAVSLDYHDIFQHGMFLRHFNDTRMARIPKTANENASSYSFSDPGLINLFNLEDAVFYLGPRQSTSPAPQNKVVTYDLSPSKTNVVLVLAFQVSPKIRDQPFALIPDRNLILNAYDALSLTTYARNEQHLQEIMAMYPDSVFLPVYTSDEDPVGAPILQPFDDKGNISAFIAGLRQRAEKAIRN